MSDDVESSASETEDGAEVPPLDVDLESFVEAVADADEELADEVEVVRDHIETLRDDLLEATAEVDELTSRLKRAHADFDNYKKRIERRQDELRASATKRLLEHLVDIRTDLNRAVETEEQTVEELIEGVKLTLNEVDRLLDAEGVKEIRPDPGEPIDPHRHEVMASVDSDEPADTIAEVYEPGYIRDGTVLKDAKVTVSNGSASDIQDVDEETG